MKHKIISLHLYDVFLMWLAILDKVWKPDYSYFAR